MSGRGGELPPLPTAGQAGRATRRPLGQALAAYLRPYSLAVLSALLVTLAFPPAEISWLAYLAPVILLVMAVRTPRPRKVFLAGWLGGLVFFGFNMHWIWPITAAGCLALIPYMALYWAVFAWGVRRIGEAVPVPLALSAPALWVAMEYLRGRLLTGLPWVFLAHTQYENLVLIQISDVLGAYGVSFLVMMTAGLAADWLARPIFVPGRDAKRRFSPMLAAATLLTAAAWTGTAAYGFWRLGQPTKRPGPVVATVQTCVPQEVKNIVKSEQIQTAEDERRFMEEVCANERLMLDEQLALTAGVLAREPPGLRPDLICWPETMVPGIVGRTFLEYGPPVVADYPRLAELQERSRTYWNEVHAASRRAGAPILFGGHSAELRPTRSGLVTFANQRNTAFLVAPDSSPYAAEHTYAKAHLVPFGEYVPFRESWPWLHRLLGGLTPYDYDYSLTPGAHDQPPFVIRHDGSEARFQVPICYEDAMPYRVREMVRSGDPSRPKAVDFLVNISNDGWFSGSIELDQHLNLCVFRAVENRVPIVRSVNTGISAIIGPEGRIETVVEAGGRRRYVSGRAVGRLTLDDRAAPYTRIGDAFAVACLVIAGGLGAGATLRGRFRR